MSAKPSPEAVKVLVLARYATVAVEQWQWDAASDLLEAAMAVDIPAIEAKAREAAIREVVEWVRKLAIEQEARGGDSTLQRPFSEAAGLWSAFADLTEAKFLGGPDDAD